MKTKLYVEVVKIELDVCLNSCTPPYNDQYNNIICQEGMRAWVNIFQYYHSNNYVTLYIINFLFVSVANSIFSFSGYQTFLILHPLAYSCMVTTQLGSYTCTWRGRKFFDNSKSINKNYHINFTNLCIQDTY